MELVKKGKTKDVFKLSNGNFLLKFKDSVTGGPSGAIDPGGNEVVGEKDGMGLCCLKMTSYIFNKVAEQKLAETHLINYDFAQKTMEVLPAQAFGFGLEIIVRFVATGSFVRRYGLYVKDGQKLSAPLLEITIKDDGRNDPLINEDSLIELGLLSAPEILEIKDKAKKIALLIDEIGQKKGLTIYDLKMEFGRSKDGHLLLIDEISPGSMRAFKNEKRVEGLELSKIFLEG